jgi:hypothetical protein
MPDIHPSAGLRIVRSGELDSNNPQTPGMSRAKAISHAPMGALGPDPFHSSTSA